MFEYMLEDNEDLMAFFEKYLDPKDIAFIKELMQGVEVSKYLAFFMQEIQNDVGTA